MNMNITRTRGDTGPDVFLVSKGGVPTNLTGCSFKMTLDSRSSPSDSSTQVYQLTGVIAEVTSGKVSFTPTLTQADKVGFFFYDIQMVDSFGTVQTLVSGSYTYKQDITK